MTLSNIQSGEKIFIDANIFIYHFVGASQECKEFLERCTNNELIGITSTSILAEICHRLMMIEAVSQGLINPKQPSFQLRDKPDIVKKLSHYYSQTTNILSWNIQIVSPTKDIIIKSQIYRQRFGLLTNDSMIPVLMEDSHVSSLASADQAFHKIPHLNLYSPNDIKI